MRNLKALRVKYGLTQADMAKKLEISEVAYRNKENGYTQFTLNEARKISKIFKETIEAIFFENEVYTKETTA
ncbi:helix-turn-helix domain-containing protein [Crassaminicella thermophila]|uniref:Helix-turn-helix domain-containing protein n=1 Tax=Crassaminicella thermophila TaxID=2599308 RepID=A0A5C0SDW1_CRATE|nr:helix-turn-helix domain-containing protein [Crassaminicella thermophila]QEK12755.1 helix-turn-helix domain-containing protein [Crassaminicella thermophila]